MTYKLTNTSQPADPYYGAVSLLLHGDGADGSTQIIDSSVNPKTVTAFGDAQISTTESKWNGSSLKFDGTGDGLTVPDSSDFNFSNGDFTIELWVYFISLSGINCIATDGWNSGVFSPWLILQNNSNLQFFASSNGSSWDIATSLAIKSSASINTWYHIAVCRSGNTIRTFCDGINTGLVTSSAALVTVNSNIGIGANAIGGGDEINGYIDDIRITKGVARYTSNFTPPTQPFQSLAA